MPEHPRSPEPLELLESELIALGRTLDRDPLDPGLGQLGVEMRRHGRQLPGIAPGGDHHVIGDGGFASKVDGDDVFRLVVVQRCLHDLQKILGLVCSRLGDCLTRARNG